MIFDRIKHQDSVLSHDSHYHDHSHQRNHVEGLAGDKKREKHASESEHRTTYNRDGMSVGAEFDEQGDKYQQHGQHECNRQFAKAGLLLLIKPSKLDSHAGRQLHIFGHDALDFGNCSSEILAFKTSSDRDSLAQILAIDFGLAFLVLDIGHLINSKQGAGGRPDLQAAHLFDRRAYIIGIDDAHFDQAVLLQDV